MAVITPIICARTGRKGIEVRGLPTRDGKFQSFTAYGPDALYEALKKWEGVRPKRAAIVCFSLGGPAHA